MWRIEEDNFPHSFDVMRSCIVNSNNQNTAKHRHVSGKLNPKQNPNIIASSADAAATRRIVSSVRNISVSGSGVNATSSNSAGASGAVPHYGRRPNSPSYPNRALPATADSKRSGLHTSSSIPSTGLHAEKLPQPSGQHQPPTAQQQQQQKQRHQTLEQQQQQQQANDHYQQQQQHQLGHPANDQLVVPYPFTTVADLLSPFSLESVWAKLTMRLIVTEILIS